MRPHIRLLAAFMAIMALAPGAMCLEIGGGLSASAGQDSTIQGSFSADKSSASTFVSAKGSVPHAGELRFVQDDSGKRAEISFDVTNAVGAVKYSATFSPKEGGLGKTVPSVSATQALTVPAADSVFLHAAAQSANGSNVTAANLAAVRVGTFPASFAGSTSSQASATGTSVKIQGRVVGAIKGNASYGGNITGPYSAGKSRDSSGLKVDCKILMQAASTSGAGTISGVSTFAVDPTQKIQGAINASWDGDTINVAKGTYSENLILDKSVTLKGAGIGKTVVDGSKNGSVITIGMRNGNTNAALSDMTIQNGSAKLGGGILNYGRMALTGIRVYASSAEENGGGICSYGTATITKSKISDNTAQGGGGIYNEGDIKVDGTAISGNLAEIGGGFYNQGTADLKGVTLLDNSAINGGGAFFGDSSTATLTGGTISTNFAEEYGGGICNYGTVSVTKGTISGNRAHYGGGAYSSGTVDLISSTISSNIASMDGGGVSNRGTANIAGTTISGNSARYGGGVISWTGAATISKSTIAGNSATYGGGFYNMETATITDSTVSGNKAYYGGGVYNMGNLFMGGASQITKNQATIGGGLYSTISSVTFDGTKASIKNNKATLPLTPGVWYGSYGVYIEGGEPVISGGFDPAKQVTGNTKA